MLLGFKKQFAPKILAGSKVMTVRQQRKVEPKIGEVLHMYTGLRTRNCEKITSEYTLKGIQSVDFLISKSKTEDLIDMDVFVDRVPLDRYQLEKFALADGFDSAHQLAEYWMSTCDPDDIQVLKRSIQASIIDMVIYHWSDLRF